jgi:hypothetical protein
MKKTLPYVAFGNDELDRMPEAGEKFDCPRCKKKHLIRYGHQVESDGTKTPSRMIGFVRCKGKSYLVSVRGMLV